MTAKMIHVTPGPSIADPGDFINLIVDQVEGGSCSLTMRTPLRYTGFRGLWLRLLIWGIRNYVEGLN
jgi:hypothetical protein